MFKRNGLVCQRSKKGKLLYLCPRLGVKENILKVNAKVELVIPVGAHLLRLDWTRLLILCCHSNVEFRTFLCSASTSKCINDLIDGKVYAGFYYLVGNKFCTLYIPKIKQSEVTTHPDSSVIT